jgi:subtilisin-like proprotein convertase family protein
MKTKICLLGLLLAFSVPAGAALYQYGALAGGSALGAIPDNNTIGLTESFTASEAGSSISALTLTIQLQNGSATDLSGYLRLGNTTGSPYYNLTSLIQAQTLSAGSPTTFSIDFGTPGFSTAFNGQNPNDTWTLFFADKVAGDTTTLNGWRLDVTAVPEPVNMALGLLGGFLLALAGIRGFKRRCV